MKIRKSYQNQMSLLPYSTDDIQWHMLPPNVRQDVQDLLAQLIVSIYCAHQSPSREAHYVTQNN